MNVRVARLSTTVLGATCAFLVLTALLQYAGVGRGYSWAPDDPASVPALPGGGAVDEKPIKVPPETAFAEINAHPLFNDDRQPTPADAGDTADASAAPQGPLNITLTGIVSTSSVKVAMVHDKARNQSIALKVGMPLEGDQASWTLVEVKPRSVVFRNAANESSEVELETSVAQMRAPLPRTSRSSAPSNNARSNVAARDNRRANSSDLAKRIEERRRQMREDAEKLRNQPQAGKGRPPPPPPNRSAPPPKK
jgi:general secretion pathway protein N